MLNDTQLVRLAKEGQIAAFESLITKYKDKVFNIAFSYTANYAASDDIAQNVFVKVYLNLSSFQEKAAFSTWLYRITINECFNGLKKERKKNTVSLESEISGQENILLKDTLADPNADIEQKFISSETQKLIRSALLKLSDKYRMILTLRDIEDISYEDIAKIMKISDAKVKVWLFRARRKLKTILDKKAK
ncbi:RNA polymerase sigma factor [Endomicrobium proavitum]|uniref:RNA polymerase sigma factor n=1 Tax=Endomicrobium proavitum TaxID=1408281 RepID=A0A0G3WLH6_9BACT|nr:RNA polymerase sigma factor [Endomicrobium proavitum]AKL98717.1 putative ECF RNA polymerase sigma factor SigW [Endomicrobium proavitum]